MVCCFVLFLALPAGAQAPNDDERARTHFESGRLHFDEGDYEAALAEFQSAYELSGRDQLLFNLYLAYERLGRTREAADHLERYLATDLVPEGDRETLTRRLAHLRERTAADEAPDPMPETAPGTEGDAHPLLVPGIAVLAAGGVGLALFGILGGLALAEDGALASRCGADAGRTCTDADVSGLRSLSIGADVSLAIGLAAAATGAVLLILDATSSPTPDASALRVSPFFAGSSGGLVLAGSFGGAS